MNIYDARLLVTCWSVYTGQLFQGLRLCNLYVLVRKLAPVRHPVTLASLYLRLRSVASCIHPRMRAKRSKACLSCHAASQLRISCLVRRYHRRMQKVKQTACMQKTHLDSQSHSRSESSTQKPIPLERLGPYPHAHMRKDEACCNMWVLLSAARSQALQLALGLHVSFIHAADATSMHPCWCRMHACRCVDADADACIIYLWMHACYGR